MTVSRNRSIWRTFGLAFAIVLTPALMQTQGDCGLPPGDAQLAVLKAVPWGGGEDMIVAFDPGVQGYEVMVPEGMETMVIRAESSDPAAAVQYTHGDGCVELASEDLTAGGGLFTLEPPEGHSNLVIWVHAPEGMMRAYTVFLIQPMVCQ